MISAREPVESDPRSIAQRQPHLFVIRQRVRALNWNNEWKKAYSKYGFVSFKKEDNEDATKEFSINAKNKFSFSKLVTTEKSYEDRTERYMVISEATQNVGGQPVERYKATFNKGALSIAGDR